MTYLPQNPPPLSPSDIKELIAAGATLVGVVTTLVVAVQGLLKVGRQAVAEKATADLARKKQDSDLMDRATKITEAVNADLRKDIERLDEVIKAKDAAIEQRDLQLSRLRERAENTDTTRRSLIEYNRRVNQALQRSFAERRKVIEAGGDRCKACLLADEHLIVVLQDFADLFGFPPGPEPPNPDGETAVSNGGNKNE